MVQQRLELASEIVVLAARLFHESAPVPALEFDCQKEQLFESRLPFGGFRGLVAVR